MPKNPSETLGGWAQVQDEKGRLVYGPDGKILKEKVKICDGTLPDGTSQALYFRQGHLKAGWFKGIAVILEDQPGFTAEWSQLETKCNEHGITVIFLPKFHYFQTVHTDLLTHAKELTGKQAAWASKKYQGHCVPPEKIMDEFDAAHPLGL
ncbi:hypothetical protein P691DRAFT_789052 [Macrolepiota fuliginosa MF-IS2]|uniref:Uncharacterized protein n=1 Tax=Macrolepiota fuliginosa MF-IS2 TaxID=1400762 RepID=A0A9P5X174_9AGAR|nr:hypothetical protein P691DRAFT_789052 [Macrolepiota fuliginosa MF-IS2]